MALEFIYKCPLCSCEVNNSINRLIKEYCGHVKCRQCLLKEIDGCCLCKNEQVVQTEDKIASDIVDVKLITKSDIETNTNEEKTIIYKLSEGTANLSDEDESSSDKLQIDTSSDGSCHLSGDEDHGEVREGNVNADARKVKKARSKNISYDHIKTKKSDEGIHFECTICNKTFKSRGNRRYHLFCGNDTKPLKCEKCDKTFITKFHYDYHVETHLENNLFICSLCNRKFLRKNSLNKHMRKHTLTYKYFCPKCNSKFQSISNLKLHENKHNNIFPYECDKCERKFSNKSNLRNHLIIHTNEKNFACDKCEKKFYTKTALKLHENSHSTLFQFKCDECSKSFVDQRKLKRHLTIHTDNQKYNCPLCETKCTRKDNFYRHFKNLHPDSNYKEILKESASEKQNSCETKVSEDIETKSSKIVVHDGPNSVNVIKFVGNVKPIQIIPSIYQTIHTQPTLEEKKNENTVSHQNPIIPLSSYSKIPMTSFNYENFHSFFTQNSNDHESSKPVITKQINSQTINKSKQDYDPIEIYRKILMPSTDEDDDDEDITEDGPENEQIIEKSNPTTEVITKSNPIDFSEIHWRKRTSQYFIENE